MTYKPVDTAIVMVIGPCIDDTDFKTLEEAIAYDAAGMDVSLIVEKTDGTTAVTAITLTTGGTSDWTHTDGGYYEIEITATQNTEEGIAYVRGICTGVLPFESIHYNVVKANVYDSWIKGTDVLQTDVTRWLGTAAATPTVAGVPEVDLTHWLGTGVSVNVAGKPTVDVTNIGASSQSLIDLKDFVDSCYDPTNNKVQSDLIYIHGSALTETAGQLAAAFTKLFDVATPLLVASDVMRGTDSAALATTALTDVTWTDAKAAFIDHSIATVDTVADGIQTDLDNATYGLGALKALIDTVDGIVDSILADTGTDGVLLAATATSAQLVDDVWDEILSGVTHNIASSAGRRVREIGAFAIHSGTAQAGASNSITLAATANGGDGVYNRNLIVITDNTGVGQTRTIVDYDDTTKVVVVDRDWRITPDNTTAYQIVPDNTPLVVDHGVAQAGSTSTTIKLRAYASAINDNYLCNIIVIIAGTGRGQARLVGSYNGTTKVVTICGDNWVTTPDATSVYVMMPYGTTCTSCIGTDALALINTECDTALTDYDPPTRAEATTDKDAIITEVNANETKIDTLQTDSTAIKAKTDNLPDGIKKNTAYTAYTFLMVDSTDHVTAKTGLTVAGSYTGDGGAVASLTNTGAITEISNGLYEIDLTAGELNYNNVHLIFTASGADARVIGIHTST